MIEGFMKTLTSCHISLMSLLQTNFFFWSFLQIMSFFIHKNQEIFGNFVFISVNLMNIATFWEKFPKIYNKIERETKKKPLLQPFTFCDLC